MKILFSFIIGVALGVSLLFFLVIKVENIADQINLISIIVNIGIAVFVAFYIQNIITSNRYVKEFTISQLETTRNEYDFLLKSIRNNQLNRAEIVKEFKYYSIKITSIESSLKNKFKFLNLNLQSKNRSIHTLITNSNEFNTTQTNSKVRLNNSTLNNLLISQREINDIITELVFSINSK